MNRIARWILPLLTAVAFLAAPPIAGAFSFTLYAGSSMNSVQQAQVQSAITTQINTQVARHWAVPPVGFAAYGGYPLIITSQAYVTSICGSGAAGCHTPSAAFVANMKWTDTTTALSHEAIEYLVDPTSTGHINGIWAEPCDPVAWDGVYTIGNVTVDNFTYPRWFTMGTAGPWDYSGVLRGPQTVSSGGIWPDVKRWHPHAVHAFLDTHEFRLP